MLDSGSDFCDSDSAGVAERGSGFGSEAASAEAASSDFDLACDSCCPGSDVSEEASRSTGGVGRVSSCRGLVVLVAVVWAQAASTSTMKMAENVLMGLMSIFLYTASH